jgi:hypothetical protein
MNSISEGREDMTAVRDPDANVLETMRVQADCVQKIADSCAFVTVDDVTLVSKFRAQALLDRECPVAERKGFDEYSQ